MTPAYLSVLTKTTLQFGFLSALVWALTSDPSLKSQGVNKTDINHRTFIPVQMQIQLAEVWAVSGLHESQLSNVCQVCDNEEFVVVSLCCYCVLY